jgi:hypothetical protein
MRVEGFWSFGLAAVVGLASALGSGLSTTTAPVAQAALATSSTSSSSLPTGVEVFVGYADSLRASANNFPTPWNGSPMTQFRGCTTNCTWDAGAVRVVNNSTSSITVDAMTVHIDTCSFSGWAPAALAPGWEVIMTQQETGGSNGCNGSEFDTSDVGPGGSSWAGHCTPPDKPILPVVDLTINGTTTSLTDSGQVLNTGGIDTGFAPCLSNESTQWTVIGSQPCKGSVLALTPASQSRPVLSTATVVATFTNSCGYPLSNTTIQFAALSGPNMGVAGSGVTNAIGQASFSYSSSKLGTDTLRATINNTVGSISSNDATVTWTFSFAPGGGAFVIGNNGMSSAARLAPGKVLYWGAQWWKTDLLTGGTAPSAFKGFEKSNLSPWCGQTWTVTPGNSPHPPSTVPAVMAVIVADHITQKGSTVSGDIVHIVLVSTDPGYGPAPGHAGTGTIVGTIC